MLQPRVGPDPGRPRDRVLCQLRVSLVYIQESAVLLTHSSGSLVLASRGHLPGLLRAQIHRPDELAVDERLRDPVLDTEGGSHVSSVRGLSSHTSRSSSVTGSLDLFSTLPTTHCPGFRFASLLYRISSSIQVGSLFPAITTGAAGCARLLISRQTRAIEQISSGRWNSFPRA